MLTIERPVIRLKRPSIGAGSARVAMSFRAFVDKLNPSLLDFEHVPRKIEVLQKIADAHDPEYVPKPGEPNWRRVMILEPPRYFKSELASRLFPAYLLYRYPKLKVGLASYGAELAWELSEEARNYYEQVGGRLRRETAAKKRWRVERGGEMWAAGVGGPLLGRGYDVGIIDDPIDPLKAASSAFQKQFIQWYPSKWLSRAEPDATILLVMQRLASWDPVSFLWEREGDEDLAPESWHVVCFDEIKSDEPLAEYGGPQGLPVSCTLEPDPREPGEPLAPSRFSKASVIQKQASAGPDTANAQRQQRPSAATGDYWRREWFVGPEDGDYLYDALPPEAHDGGKDWDTAYTKDEQNSASAWIETYRGPGGSDEFLVYVHDLDWRWVEFPELLSWIGGLKGPHYVEGKASGKSVVQSLRRQQIQASEVAVIGGDKFARANHVQGFIASGRLRIRRAVWRKLLEGEPQGLLRVTRERLIAGGPDLDLNDTLVQAINRHWRPKPRIAQIF